MKRSPLKRLTALRRTPRKPWRRSPEDRVTEAEYNYVAARDASVGGCVMAHLDREHVCHDRFGNVVDPMFVFEVDHIDNGGVGNRGESKRTNLVRLCPYAHVIKTHSARLWRPALRAYLRRVEWSAEDVA